jgi:hypothetical protein
MARIKTYNSDIDISTEDKVIGTDGNPGSNFGKTKNFTVGALSGFIGAGSQGVQGPAGEAGATGAAGADGTDGADGVDGAQGPAGNDGATGQAGPAGQTGPAGATGQAGAQGVAGSDGTSISVLGTVANCSGLPTSGNTSGDLYVLDSDDAGCTYGAGAAGDGYVWTSGNTWLNIGPLRGPQGIQGVAGSQGDQGAAGTNGINGEQGIQGIQGIQGQPGQNGSNGPQGQTGAQGETGATGLQGPIGLTGPSGAVESVNAGTGISVTPNTTGNVTVSLASGTSTQTTGSISATISAGVSGGLLQSSIGHWVRTGDMVDVYIRMEASYVAKVNLNDPVEIRQCVPYAVAGSYDVGSTNQDASKRYIFNGSVNYVENITSAGTNMALNSIMLKPLKTAADGITDASIRLANLKSRLTRTIVTSDVAQSPIAIGVSFRYRCREDASLASYATKD